MKLTPAEISSWCEKLLKPLTRNVWSKMGEQASEHTGECLHRALCLFDGPREPGRVESYAATKTMYLVIERCRSLQGRKGSARYAAVSSQTALQDFDEDTEMHGMSEAGGVEDELDAEENLARAAKWIESSVRLQKAVLIGRVFGEFSDADLRKILDVPQATLYGLKRNVLAGAA